MSGLARSIANVAAQLRSFGGRYALLLALIGCGIGVVMLALVHRVEQVAAQTAPRQGTAVNRPALARTIPPPPATDAWWLQIGSLKGVSPLLPDTSPYIRDRLAAQQLGKALFWDTQAGRDGIACASCHFHAGADPRVKNQVNAGQPLAQMAAQTAAQTADSAFGSRARSLPGRIGPNAELTADDFPLHQLAAPANRDSDVTFDTNAVVSSQGAFSSACRMAAV
jgi:Di-haem cytochrome c peroxidase